MITRSVLSIPALRTSRAVPSHDAAGAAGRSRRLVRPAALAAASCLLFVACGGSDDSAATTDAPAEAVADDGATDEVASDDSATDGGTTDDVAAEERAASGDGEDTGTASAADDQPFSGDADSEWCRLAREVDESFLGDDAELFDLFTEDGMNEILRLLDETSSAAPDEIRGDVESVRDGFVEIRDLLAEYDFDVFRAFSEDPEALDRISQNTDIEAASDRVTKYLEDVCGLAGVVELDAGDDEPAGDETAGDATGTPIGGVDLDGVDLDGDPTEVMAQILASSFGLDEAQTDCLVENIDPSLVSADANDVDITAFLDVFSECGISLAELTGG